MSTEILNGNELIVRGGLEAGFSLYTGYPGSPLADYFNILYKEKDQMAEKGIKVVIANSEANAAAMASGAKQAGRDVLVAMKSMGLHVASDALSVGNFANPGEVNIDPKTNEELHPGVVIAVGDDPWSISTSTPADSRYLFKHLHIPFLEPSTPQELKDWMKVALDISKRTSVYQGLLLTTFMAEGGGRVDLFDEVEVDKSLVELDPSSFDLSKNVMVPPNSLKADISMIQERFPKVKKVLEDLSLDKTFGNNDARIGYISSGNTFETLKQVLEESDLLNDSSLYKLACSYPLVDNLLLPFLKKLDHLIVVEEKRGFLETELLELCSKHGLDIKIYGKKFSIEGSEQEGFPAHGGLSFEVIRDRLCKLNSVLNNSKQSNDNNQKFSWEKPLPLRLPTFCPGCPHRETLSLLKDLRKTLKDKNIDLISHGDVGCYSLSFLEPFKEMHNLSAMGQGGALGAGVDIFTKNPSIVLMGDSTFFHSGMTDISNSVQLGHDITYILLDNDNTAMTGHQMTPRSGISVEGSTRPRQNIISVVRGLGVDDIREVNPSDRYFYQNLLSEFVSKTGTKVIISNKECGLTFHGRKKSYERKEFAKGNTLNSKSFYQINTSVCEDCRACIESTGCPGLTQTNDAYGTKVQIDPQICVADSYCTKIKACPSFELVDVIDYHPTKYRSKVDISFELKDLPLPKVEKTFEALGNGENWRVVVTGVGGSGVTTISRILAEAAKEMDGRDDLDFKFVDQKGLAQRNGNVTGHLAIYPKGRSYGAVTPLGTADLLLSPDLLDGSKHIGFLSNQGLAVLDREFQMPLSIIMDNGVENKPLDEQTLLKDLEQKIGENLFTTNLKTLCHNIFGKAVYASAMVLGVAFQSGKVPFTLENMEKAFSSVMRKEELENNWLAFQLGRKLFLTGPDSLNEYLPKQDDEVFLSLLEKSIKESFFSFQNSKIVLKIYRRHLERLTQYFPEIPQIYLGQYLHDMYIYDRGKNVEDFLYKAGLIKELYKEEENRFIALRTLAKTYWIKDEVFVSHLMSSPLQKKKDNDLYLSLGKSYKKTYINRPAFDIFGKQIEFDINPKSWMLKVMRKMRFLRLILIGWHKREKEIAQNIRKELVENISKVEPSLQRNRLVQLENIKGYRDIRYQKAKGLA